MKYTNGVRIIESDDKVMNKTQYTVAFIKIWNNADDRTEAHQRMQEMLDEGLTYKAMLRKANYIRSGGYCSGNCPSPIPLRDLPSRHSGRIDWGQVAHEIAAYDAHGAWAGEQSK